MKKNCRNHECCTPSMQSADKGSTWSLHYILHRIIGMIGRRRIIHRQKNPGQRLNHKKKQGNTAENIGPANPGYYLRYLALQQNIIQSFSSDPFIKPCRYRLPHTSPLFADSGLTMTIPFSTFTGKRSNGRGGGPERTFPSLAKVAVWQGHLKIFSPASQR